MHSLELFDEVQSIKWMGALPVGICAHPGRLEPENAIYGGGKRIGDVENMENDSSLPLPVQGPSCNSSGHSVGWLIWKSGDGEDDGRPEWVKDLDEINENGDDLESPLSLLKDASFIEPLSKCGRKVMLWELRVEARADGKFQRGWTIDHPLGITVPAKRTPWPDAPPELVSMSTQKMVLIGEHTEKLTTSRIRRTFGSKRQHGQRVDLHVSSTSGSHVEERQ